MERILTLILAGLFSGIALAAEPAPAPEPAKTFIPTEQIDPDSAVSFPVDI